jgi:hypothetical protein
MSHRYRIAFRETLCSRKRGFYSSSNGFARDQSSFRETTIAAAGRDHNLNYEGSQLVSAEENSFNKMKTFRGIHFSLSHSLKLRSKSMLSHRYSRYKDHGRLNNSSIRWKENNAKRVDSVKVKWMLMRMAVKKEPIMNNLFFISFSHLVLFLRPRISGLGG